MKITYRVDRRKRGLDNLVRMYESIGTGRNGRARIGRIGRISIEAGIFDTSRRSKPARVVAGKSRQVLARLTNAAVASLQEYGTSHAPARPFIGPPLRLNRSKYMSMIAAAVSKAQRTHKSVPIATWEKIGMVMKNDIREYVRKGGGVPPPNAPSTVAKKGHGHTLLDSEQMFDAIDYRVAGA